MKNIQNLLDTLNRIAALLLFAEHEKNIEASILNGMGLAGRCVEADRVQLWRNEVIEEALHFVHKLEWLGDTDKPVKPAPVGIKFPYRDMLPARELDFLQGKPINGPLSRLPQTVRDLLGGFEIKSAAIIPILTNNRLWGFLFLGDCQKERALTGDAIDMLRSVGLLIANAWPQGDTVSDLSVREAFERCEVFWSNVECGISVIDAETREIIDINPIAVRMFGADKSLIVGRRCHQLLCPATEHNCPVMDKNQVVDRSERKFIRANGEVIPIIKSVAKIMLNGRLVLLESFTDISNLKAAEDKLRLMEITEQANKAKTNFLSNMSHEMRTPMNAILGMTAIGKSAADIERKDYALGKIEDASTHLLGIINDVLDMAKIESGKFELSLEEFSFEKMLERVLNIVSFRVEEKKQLLSLRLDKDIPPVLIGDGQRLAQIITNLLGNAVKFTPNGGSIWLNARLLEEKEDVCTIRIEVTDSGIGISAEQQARLFHSFQQAEAHTARKYGGTGLGLSISKNIVEMMGGSIWVESELGQGATFAFTFQMKRGDWQKYERTVRAISWKNLRILAVDDNAGISGYIKNFVGSFGAHCDTAACGADALRLVRQNDAYDIVFTDWKMPDIDGFALTKRLKTMEPNPAKTVVIMLASTEWRDVEEYAKGAGVDNFLPKPLFPAAIEEIINNFLGVLQRQIDDTAANMEDSFKGKRILLAEDIEINREIVRSLLEPTLLEIDCAQDGAEAVRLFAENPGKYGMIFMDVQMPVMEGYEATRKIRAAGTANAAEIPIIAMTASVFREDIDRCLAAGMNGHIGKPLNLNEVLEKLRRYL